ncbi:hypothetical protein BGZ57DRAFT_186676 [Hyaloscypha finlandica]|nr:hypothetical protein BGZ57DRAFT_186676 [Hyaloscypha finlandica]
MNSIEESRRKPQVDPCSLLWERARRNPILVHRPRLAQNIQGQSRPSRSSPFFAGCSTSSEGHASIQPAERLKAERACWACWACWRQWSACLLKPALSLIRHSTVLAGLTQSEFSCQHPAITIPRARPGWHAGVGDRTAHALSRSFSNNPSHPKDIHLASPSESQACLHAPLPSLPPPPPPPSGPHRPSRYFCPRNPATAPGAIELIPSMRRETVAEAALQFAWTCFCEFPKPSLGAVLHALLQSAADLLLPSTICKDVARSW